MATITGTDASDFLVGTADGDLVNGGLGNDTIRGLGGNDTLNGAEGNDDLDGGDGNDYLIGGAGNDTLQGGMNADTLEGGAGDDVLRGGKGHDSIDGGEGNDTIYSGLGQDTLTGGAGADVFVVRGSDPNFPGALKAPTITDFVAGTDSVVVEGATDADITAALAAQTTVDGGVSLSINGATVVVKGSGLTSLTSANVSNTVPTSIAGETFTLTTGIDNLSGGSGNDTFIADQSTSSSADQINGGAGTDTFKLYTTGAVALPTLADVENAFIEGANVAIDTSTVSGLSSLELSKYDLTAGRNVKVSDGTKVGVSNTTGTANAITLTNNTATSQDVAFSLSGDATNAIDLDIDGDKVGTLNVEATGKSFINVINTGALLKTVNISGSADLVVENVAAATAINITNSAKTSVDTAVAKVAVTGGAGAETVTLDHATATAHEFSVSTGAGNDRIVFNALAVAADLTDSKVTISGGEGTDTLAMLSAMGAALSGLSAANFTKKGIANDFEILEITNQAAAADDVNITRLGSNITTVDYAAGLGDAQTLQGLASGGTVVLGAAAGAGTDSLVVTVKDAAAAGSNTDVLNIKLDGAHAGATLDYGELTAAAVETINIDSTSTKTTALVAADVNMLDLTLANAVNVTITGNVYADLDGTALAGNALSKIDASANTAGVAVSVNGATQGILITGTAKADTIIGGSGADKIVAGAGNDTLTGGAGNDELDISGGGSNTLIFAATAAGNGKDTIIGFNVGAVAGGGDVMDVTLITPAGITANITSLTGAQQLANNNLFTVNYGAAIADKDFGGADFADLFAAAGKAFSTTNGAANDQAVIVVQGTDVTHVYYFDDAGTDTTVAVAEVTLVGVVNGVTNADTFVAANFA